MIETEQLREDVRATAPEPSLEFTTRMDRAVESGFRRGRKEREPRRINLWAPTVALACTALVAVVVGLASLDNGDDDEGGSVEAPALSMEESGGSGGEADLAAPPAPPPSSNRALSPVGADDALRSRTDRVRGRGDNRVVERSTSLALETGADEFRDVSDDILQLADEKGAIVQSSRVAERDGKAVARYDLRVPSSRLDDTLAALTELAHVTSRTSASEDITRSYVSATDRLDDARAERDALLKALEKADNANQAAALRGQIALARDRIAAAQRD
ncbi:MAG TPA: DUF4349 domain-containing protein, partial [Solirubrobacteraceae bacterium]